MRTRTGHQNRILRIIMTPIRVLGRARDCYVTNMVNYTENMNCNSGMATPTLPRSFSRSSSSSSQYNESEDLRELVRAASARTYLPNKSTELYNLEQQRMRMNLNSNSGSRSTGMAKSSSVAMGRIDEERPCCYFGDVTVDLKYPRSRSHAVAGRTVF